MTSFYYFLPGVRSDELVEGRVFKPRPPLEYFGDGLKVPQEVTVSDVASGPGSASSGVIVQPTTQDSESPVTGYRPNQQQWSNHEGVSIGWLPDRPPQPASLARAKMIPGGQIDDRSGATWQVPVARSPEGSLLPVQYRYGPAGSVIAEEVLSQWMWLWDLSGEVWDYFNWSSWQKATAENEAAESWRPADLPRGDSPPPGATRDRQWLSAQALRVLGVNYRFSWLEANAFCELGRPVLTDDFALKVCWVLIDAQIIEEVEAEKKTDEPQVLATTSGAPDDTTPSEQPAAAN